MGPYPRPGDVWVHRDTRRPYRVISVGFDTTHDQTVVMYSAMYDYGGGATPAFFTRWLNNHEKSWWVRFDLISQGPS